MADAIYQITAVRVSPQEQDCKTTYLPMTLSLLIPARKVLTVMGIVAGVLLTLLVQTTAGIQFMQQGMPLMAMVRMMVIVRIIGILLRNSLFIMLRHRFAWHLA